MFDPNTKHCTTCQAVNPETDEDGETTCCLDTVCEVDENGRCDRCNPQCTICGWDMTDGYEIDSRGFRVHPDKTCPKGDEPKKTRTRKPAAKKTEKTTATPTKRASGSHADCDHDSTKSARAACRRQRNAGK